MTFRCSQNSLPPTSSYWSILERAFYKEREGNSPPLPERRHAHGHRPWEAVQEERSQLQPAGTVPTAQRREKRKVITDDGKTGAEPNTKPQQTGQEAICSATGNLCLEQQQQRQEGSPNPLQTHPNHSKISRAYNHTCNRSLCKSKERNKAWGKTVCLSLQGLCVFAQQYFTPEKYFETPTFKTAPLHGGARGP